MSQRFDKPYVYGATSKDKIVLRRSSSGGMFTVLSDGILEDGGYVFGAVYGADARVMHVCAQNKEQRDKMRGSKYIKSYVKEAYKEAKQLLDDGKKVMFFATPCQIDALYKVLGKEYDNLVTCDLICHGVADVGIWKEYIEFIRNKVGKRVSALSFRHKQVNGEVCPLIKYTDNTNERFTKEAGLFNELYYSDFIMLPSCYKCKYTKTERVGDITIGDFHGITKIKPELNDKFAVSLVLVNTDKGMELFEKARENTSWFESTLEDCMQPSLMHPLRKSLCHDEFWYDYEQKGFNFILKKYFGYSIIFKLKRKAKQIIGRYEYHS